MYLFTFLNKPTFFNKFTDVFITSGDVDVLVHGHDVFVVVVYQICPFLLFIGE